LPVYFAAAWGTPKLNPGTSGILFMTEISVGAISAALLTNEPFGLREILGVGLITAAGLTEAVAPILTTLFYGRGPLRK
jgi:drug/metabolite transporter (DMT)-like permease